jgi:hypothetical protein
MRVAGRGVGAGRARGQEGAARGPRTRKSQIFTSIMLRSAATAAAAQGWSEESAEEDPHCRISVSGAPNFCLGESGRVRGTGGTDLGRQRREVFPTAGRAGPLAPVADVGERAIAAGGDGRECPPAAGIPPASERCWTPTAVELSLACSRSCARALASPCAALVGGRAYISAPAPGAIRALPMARASAPPSESPLDCAHAFADAARLSLRCLAGGRFCRRGSSRSRAARAASVARRSRSSRTAPHFSHHVHRVWRARRAGARASSARLRSGAVPCTSAPGAVVHQRQYHRARIPLLGVVSLQRPAPHSSSSLDPRFAPAQRAQSLGRIRSSCSVGSARPASTVSSAAASATAAAILLRPDSSASQRARVLGATQAPVLQLFSNALSSTWPWRRRSCRCPRHLLARPHAAVHKAPLVAVATDARLCLGSRRLGFGSRRIGNASRPLLTPTAAGAAAAAAAAAAVAAAPRGRLRLRSSGAALAHEPARCPQQFQEEVPDGDRCVAHTN